MIKKSKSRKRHKPVVRSGVSACDLLFASPTQPIRGQFHRNYFLHVYSALDDVSTNEIPDAMSWNLLNDICNLTETLVLQGFCEDGDGIVNKASVVLGRCGTDFIHNGKMSLTADDASALRAMIDDYESIVSTIPHREFVLMHRSTIDRLG